MKISNKVNDVVLVGRRDAQTQLILLQQVKQRAFLAKAYGGGDSSDLEILKKLHLRLGHRNFIDVARQHKLPIPKVIPACTSCIMAKGHSKPHILLGDLSAPRAKHKVFTVTFAVPSQSLLLKVTSTF